jgi:hypothetical protein
MSFIVAFQAAIAATGTPQNLPSNPVVRSVTLTAKSTNTAAIVVGNSPNVTATTGYVLEKGQSITLDAHSGNTNSLWVVGTAADVVSGIGA